MWQATSTWQTLENDRVMRWCRGATQGTVVVGGYGPRRRSKSVQWSHRFVLRSSAVISMSLTSTIIECNAFHLKINKEHFLVSLSLDLAE